MNDTLNEKTVLTEYDFNKSRIPEIDHLLDVILKNCRNK